jgi:hypothetical protein
MKKYFLIAFILFASINAKAQIDKIVGDWIEVRHFRIDTLDAGMELVRKKPKAYANGDERLDPKEYMVLSDITPEEEFKMKLTISKEQDFFWAKDGNNFKAKITYSIEFKDYIVVFPLYRTSLNFVVKYDDKGKKLLFKDLFSEDIYYEFVRKE